MIVGGNFTFDPSFNLNKIDSSKTKDVLDFSAASGAAAEDAFIHSPTKSMYELARNQLPDELDDIKLSKDQLKAKVNTDYYAQYMTMPEEGMTKREYDTKYEAIRAEKIRENTLMRAPATIGQFVKTLGVSLGVSMLDPTSIALGYMPAALARSGYIGVKAATTAKQFDDSMQAANAGGRALLRAKAGAGGGAFEGAVAEAPVYLAANERGEKYGASEVFTSIATGVVVGTGIQVTAGSLFDVATIHSRALERERIRTTEEIRLQTIADKEKNVELKKEKQAAADAYSQQVIESRATPDNLLKFEDPNFVGPFSREDLEDLMLHSFLKARETSGIQRKLSDYNAEERDALMQAGLSQFIQGKNVLGHEFTGAFEARLLGDRYRPEDIEAVRAEVIKEHLMQERINQRGAEITPEVYKAYEVEQNDLLTGIAEARGAIDGPTVIQTKGLRGKRLKAAQKELAEQQALRKEAHAKLKKLESELAASKKKAKDQGKKFTSITKREEQIRRGELPEDVLNSVNSEVQRRMGIIDEIHLSKPEYNMGNLKPLNKGIKQVFTDMKAKTESPAASRTYRPDAEEHFSERGRRTKPTEDSQRLESEMNDAVENAQKIAEANDTKYGLTKEEESLVGEIENMKKVADKLSVCMGRAA